MNDRKQMFIKLFELMEVNDIPSEFSNAELENISFSSKYEENIWTIKIVLPNVLPVQIIADFVNRLTDSFTNLYHARVEVNLRYLDCKITEDLFKKYYNYLLKECCEKHTNFLTLKKFEANFINNQCIYYVADEDDKKIIQDLVIIIQNKFHNYGITSVEFLINISDFESPMSKIIDMNLHNAQLETIKNQVIYDEKVKGFDPNGKTKEGVMQTKKPKMGSAINGKVTELKDIPVSQSQVTEYEQKNGNASFVIVADVLESVVREVKGGYKIYEATVSDGSGTIFIKTFVNTNNAGAEEKFYREECKTGVKIRSFGYVEYDKFSRDVVFRIKDIMRIGNTLEESKTDNAPEKRVELHAHSKMSTQDGIMDVGEYVKTAIKFGHKAVAITDHNSLQSLPDLYNATINTDIKPIYGVEGNLVSEEKYVIAFGNHDIILEDASYVVYDLETTGFSAISDEIIEIGAVKLNRGLIVDTYSCLVKPKKAIPLRITEITGITNDDVRLASCIKEVMPEFKKFIGNCVLVAQNASFDNSFLYENLMRLGLYDGTIPTIDTLQYARINYHDKLKSFNLKSIANFLNVDLKIHHRAVHDAEATAHIFSKILNELRSKGIKNYNEINNLIDLKTAFKNQIPKHVTILVKNETGRVNLNKIISDAHTVHFHREPRILKMVLETYREGLLIGSSCYNGDVFDTALNKNYDELLTVANFYDYLEVQPPEVYGHLVENGDTSMEEKIKEAIKKIIKAGKQLGKIIVATGDVHHLERSDLAYREIYINALMVGGGRHDLYDSKGTKKAKSQHYRTTEEMLKDFDFLDNALAYEIVVTNSNKIANMIENIPIFPKELYAPKDDFMKDKGVPSFKEAVYEMTMKNARDKYGEILPKYLENRINKELNSIIKNNYASIYYISHLLVSNSKKAGYVVGSRGSVGSSIVATLMEITEVNPLAPHYLCPKCHFSVFKLNNEEKRIYSQTANELLFENILQQVGVGYDLEDAKCPVCNNDLDKDGFDIPFETFLGFKGDKIPDIDLNFSGEYQKIAHDFCKELFGEDYSFRAGTISTIAEKTAFGYVKGFLERHGKEARYSEISMIAKKIEGVKRSTGQHPGGIVVVPKEIHYSLITPIQYPADDTSAVWRTTHYDYHKFESNLLKLDILGHDDPTMIRYLMNFVDTYPDEFPFKKVEAIPISDSKVVNLFNSLDSIGLNCAQAFGENIATTGLPEFGTSLTKDMLEEIRPTTINELVKISGLSHGENVWNGNAREYMRGEKHGTGKIPFKDLIGCRDDIMVYLISKDLPSSDAFKIMEDVRKGKGVTPELEDEMLKFQVPKWYIDSCKLIKYMFPKAHAAAYVIMALRIGWFKVYKPIYYYASFFSKRAKEFDIIPMIKGWESINLRLKELNDKIKVKAATLKEEDIYNTLLLALEMTARGFNFAQIDINKSAATDFLVCEDKRTLLLPFSSLESLGETTANKIVSAREEFAFTSKKDAMRRGKINATVFERMNTMGIFGDLPDDDQFGLFKE